MARDKDNRLYTYENKLLNSFSNDGHIKLLNKKEIQSIDLKNKQKIKTRIRSNHHNLKKIELEIIILRITSKYFKKLYTLSFKNDHVFIKDKHDHDLLLHKALKYIR